MNELDRQIKRLWEITRVNKPWLLNDKEYMTNMNLWLQVEKDPSEIIYYNEFVRLEDTEMIKEVAREKKFNKYAKLKIKEVVEKVQKKLIERGFHRDTEVIHKDKFEEERPKGTFLKTEEEVKTESGETKTEELYIKPVKYESSSALMMDYNLKDIKEFGIIRSPKSGVPSLIELDGVKMFANKEVVDFLDLYLAERGISWKIL